MADKQNQLNTFWEELKSTLKLNVDYAKLTAAEKMTMLLTSIATGVGIIWAYFIMCAFYVLILAAILAFRKQLIINPIARFVSRLFFNS